MSQNLACSSESRGLRRPAGFSVLISSAGRRVGLVRAFQEAVHPLGGRVVAVDHRPDLSAACHVADLRAQVPRIDDPSFLEATLRIARSEGAGLIVPTLDTELALLASVRNDWAELGVHISVSDPELVRQCRDKRRTAFLFESFGIPPLREVHEGEYPRFIKPVSGSLSSDVHRIIRPEDMQIDLADRSRYVHQEAIDRGIYAEFTVDALYSVAGELVCAVPRRRLEVRGGEISKGRTEKGAVLEFVRTRLGHVPGARGCLTMQFFHSPHQATRPTIGIEINPRFGGGYPMSHAAGATYSSWLVGETFQAASLTYRDDWQDGLTFLRFDEQVVVGA